MKSSVWHQRSGHLTNEVLSVMLAKSQVSHTLDDFQSLCTSCIHGKMSRKPFFVKVTRCIFSFDRIHTDIWGPSPVKSIEGYSTVFVDDCTRFVWIFPLFNKSEVFNIFVKFYKFIEVQFRVKIKSLQSDSGGEFTSKVF